MTKTRRALLDVMILTGAVLRKIVKTFLYSAFMAFIGVFAMLSLAVIILLDVV